MSHASTRGDSSQRECVVDFHAPLLRGSKEEAECRDDYSESLARDVSFEELTPIREAESSTGLEPSCSETPTGIAQDEYVSGATPPIAPQNASLSSLCQGELGSFSRKLRDDFFARLASRPIRRDFRVSGAPIRHAREALMERHGR